MEDYNAQRHWTHREREDGRLCAQEVLGFAVGVRHREEELRRTFFSTRFARVLDSLGYTRFLDSSEAPRRRLNGNLTALEAQDLRLVALARASSVKSVGEWRAGEAWIA